MSEEVTGFHNSLMRWLKPCTYGIFLPFSEDAGSSKMDRRNFPGSSDQLQIGRTPRYRCFSGVIARQLYRFLPLPFIVSSASLTRFASFPFLPSPSLARNSSSPIPSPYSPAQLFSSLTVVLRAQPVARARMTYPLSFPS